MTEKKTYPTEVYNQPWSKYDPSPARVWKEFGDHFLLYIPDRERLVYVKIQSFSKCGTSDDTKRLREFSSERVSRGLVQRMLTSFDMSDKARKKDITLSVEDLRLLESYKLEKEDKIIIDWVYKKVREKENEKREF